jgi:hypothetical protein
MTLTQNVSACTSIKESSIDKSDLIIFPNPASGKFTVRNGDSAKGKVMDTQGRVIRSFETSAPEFTAEIQLEISGIYFVFLEGHLPEKILVE